MVVRESQGIEALESDRLVSVIIPTHSRVDSLRRLLISLALACEGKNVVGEVIVANNASEPQAARAIETLVADLSPRYLGRIRQIREPLPGKCRAQNRAVEEARGRILAFLDDDVEVAPTWPEAVAGFFATRPFGAMQGAILMPPAVREDAEFLRDYHRYRTINFLDYGPSMKEIYTLTGANMAIRREVFDRVGFFDERLGPGALGISEDVEYAKRIISCDYKIGYEPRAIVYHEADRSRLTEEFFRLRHEQQGRSRLHYKKSALSRIVWNFARAVWALGWYSLLGPERKKYRAKGRYFHYRAMLSERLKKEAARG
jgi:GT2 family glycosyltransferase